MGVVANVRLRTRSHATGTPGSGAPSPVTSAPGGCFRRRAHHGAAQAPSTTWPTWTGSVLRQRSRRLLRGWRQRQHGQGLGFGELGAGGDQRARVELPQGAAQGIDVPLAGLDQTLMGPGQHLGVAAVVLSPRDLVAASVSAHHLWVDRVDLVADGQHGPTNGRGRFGSRPPPALSPRHRRPPARAAP